MQAVRSAEHEALTPEEKARWLRIVDGIGKERETQAVPKQIENDLQDKAVCEFLEELWRNEELKRRRREKWSLPLLALLFLSILLLTLGLVLWTPVTGSKRPSSLATLGSLLAAIFFLLIGFFAQKRQRQRGLAFLVTKAPLAPDCAVLIEAIGFAPFEQEAKRRLLAVLPDFHDTDIPALDKHHQQVLLGELESGLTRGMYPGKCVSTDTDIAFLAAVIRYFEQEARRDNPITDRVKTILSRFICSKVVKEKHLPWNPVRVAAESCLAQGR